MVSVHPVASSQHQLALLGVSRLGCPAKSALQMSAALADV